MAVVHDTFLDDVAFLPERRRRRTTAAPEPRELLRWAAWLDDARRSGMNRESALDALLDAAGHDAGVLTAAWVYGLRAQREGTVTRRAVELLRATIDCVDDDTTPNAPLTLLG